MWHFTRLSPRVFLVIATILAWIGLLATPGCMTTDNSDMPWNAPQSWEGSPSIPGLTAGQ